MTRLPPSRPPNLLLALCLLLVVLAGLPGDVFAVSTESPGQGQASADRTVVEHLRLKVPAGARQAWLQAEQETWEPWLQRQDGFLGRQLLWDPEKEEGILLIHWRSRPQWLAIPESDIAAVQRRFEAAARRALAVDPGAADEAKAVNPFPLVYAGELEVP